MDRGHNIPLYSPSLSLGFMNEGHIDSGHIPFYSDSWMPFEDISMKWKSQHLV